MPIRNGALRFVPAIPKRERVEGGREVGSWASYVFSLSAIEVRDVMKAKRLLPLTKDSADITNGRAQDANSIE